MPNSTPGANCPICGKPAEWSPANPYRPFCCQRCKQIDLGAWAGGSYRIAGSAPADALDPGGADGGDALGAGGKG